MAVDIRKEMVDYLISRSESFVAEFVVEQGGDGIEMSDDPVDAVADFVEDFVASKRNVLSVRVLYHTMNVRKHVNIWGMIKT